MNIALIYLPHPYLVNPNLQAPLGLLYVAASLEQAGHEVIVKNYSGWTEEQALEDLEEADLYGITLTSLEMDLANSFAASIKTKFPDVHIILGGPGTATPQSVNWTIIDAIVDGEGEEIIHDLIAELRDNGKFNEKIYKTANILDLDKIPIPARHLLSTDSDTLSIITSRGCPFNCSFCASPMLTGRRMRYRSVENVIKEIKDSGAKKLIIYDDMFTANKKRMLMLCKEIEKLGIEFRMNIRSKPLDIEMLYAAKRAGCTEAAVGIESFDQDVLDIFDKGSTVADHVNALWMLDKVDIDSRLLMMVRTPGQTKKTLARNKYWLERVPYDMVCCFIFVPIPGCDVWANPDRYNIEILSNDLAMYNYGFFDAAGETPLMPIFKQKNRSLEEFHAETEEFKKWLVTTQKVNFGDKTFISGESDA